jgi:monoterpene epsilon-lactone hydrolase
MPSAEFLRLRTVLERNRRPPGVVDVSDFRTALERSAFPVAEDVRVEPAHIDGVRGTWLSPPCRRDDRAVLYLHGGGYVMGSPTTHGRLAGDIAIAVGVPVFVADYRLAPEHPFPAALEDAVRAYRWLRGRFGSASIAVVGDSAGGGLTVATLLAIRDRGWPQPATAVCLSPWLDLSLRTYNDESLAALDPISSRHEMAQFAAIYLNSVDAEMPLASPLFADLGGLPPLLIHVGTADLGLHEARLFTERARAAGVDATLEVWLDMVHVWHAFSARVPEAAAAVEGVGSYIRDRLDQKPPTTDRS